MPAFMEYQTDSDDSDATASRKKELKAKVNAANQAQKMAAEAAHSRRGAAAVEDGDDDGGGGAAGGKGVKRRKEGESGDGGLTCRTYGTALRYVRRKRASVARIGVAAGRPCESSGLMPPDKMRLAEIPISDPLRILATHAHVGT